MAILDHIKLALRITHDAFDLEVNDLIEEARADLVLAGVLPSKVNDDSDSLINRALRTYAKANFGLDNPDQEKLNESYTAIKQHLTLSQKYTDPTYTGGQ